MGLFRRLRRRSGEGPVGVDVGWATAVGPRADNQDRCRATARWAVVSDGAGGQAGGARAAELTVAATAAALDAGRSLDEAVAGAHAAVAAGRAAEPGLAVMAATLTAAVLLPTAGRPEWLVANVGDSPAWHVSPGPAGGDPTAVRLTREHNVAAELVRAGALTPDQARTHPGRHHITRAIGADPQAGPDLARARLAPGEALVLASDGIEAVDAADLAAVVITAPTAQAAADALIGAALARRTTDNVTAVVLRLPSFPHGSRSR